ncbi:uncharacterized protein BCR38DRAFT_483581 [Pseudomassariella vexata]|uniref:Uncharacterized protein n=1 Tax=Pseudomassariella vexata TaxID=1141098 RepID=A0A1Y2E3H5_9PEZI|nr:uncharacterized protein BCR38DRAFT_483581 [Pseudomassariella vexata]ORY65914.1 hypothetical protein BCR38DRAFT_483581 [Pseudomassariella vexata]
MSSFLNKLTKPEQQQQHQQAANTTPTPTNSTAGDSSVVQNVADLAAQLQKGDKGQGLTEEELRTKGAEIGQKLYEEHQKNTNKTFAQTVEEVAGQLYDNNDNKANTETNKKDLKTGAIGVEDDKNKVASSGEKKDGLEQEDVDDEFGTDQLGTGKTGEEKLDAGGSKRYTRSSGNKQAEDVEF